MSATSGRTPSMPECCGGIYVWSLLFPAPAGIFCRMLAPPGRSRHPRNSYDRGLGDGERFTRPPFRPQRDFRAIFVLWDLNFLSVFAAKPSSPGTHSCRFPSPVRHGGHKRPSRFPPLLRCSRRHAEQPVPRSCYLQVVRNPRASRQSQSRREIVSSSRCARPPRRYPVPL